MVYDDLNDNSSNVYMLKEFFLQTIFSDSIMTMHCFAYILNITLVSEWNEANKNKHFAFLFVLGSNGTAGSPWRSNGIPVRAHGR